MNDREKVIKGLEETEIMLTQAVDRGGEMAVMGAFKCLNHVIDAITLLKAQELAYWVEETDRERHWHCSNCGRVQGIASVSMKYCPECGYEMIEHPWAASGCGQAFCPGKDE